MSTPNSEFEDLVAQRKKKLKAIADLGFELYPRKWEFTHSLPQILAEYSSRTAQELDAARTSVRIIEPQIHANERRLKFLSAYIRVHLRLMNPFRAEQPRRRMDQ